jgi:hypothetical protein
MPERESLSSLTKLVLGIREPTAKEEKDGSPHECMVIYRLDTLQVVASVYKGDLMDASGRYFEH